MAPPPGGFADERIVAVHQNVCDACRAHDKFAGAGFIADEELLRRYFSDIRDAFSVLVILFCVFLPCLC